MIDHVSVPDNFRRAYFVQAKITPCGIKHHDDEGQTKFTRFLFDIETSIGNDDLEVIWTGEVRFPHQTFLTDDEIMDLNFEDLNKVTLGILIANAPKDENRKLDIAFRLKSDSVFSKEPKLNHEMYFGKDADFTHNFLDTFTKWVSMLWYNMPNITLAKGFNFNGTEFAMGCEYQGMGIGFGRMRHEDGTEETLIIDDNFNPHIIPLEVNEKNHYAYTFDEDDNLIPLLDEEKMK